MYVHKNICIAIIKLFLSCSLANLMSYLCRNIYILILTFFFTLKLCSIIKYCKLGTIFRYKHIHYNE